MSDKKLQLADPYAALTKKNKTVTSIAVSDLDRAYVYAINPQQSVLQVTLNCLFCKFVKAMRKAGYKTYNPDGYVDAVTDMEITVPKYEKLVEEGEQKPIKSALNV